MVATGKLLDALVERAGRMRYLLGDNGYDGSQPAAPHAAREARIAPFFPAATIASAPSATISNSTAAAT